MTLSRSSLVQQAWLRNQSGAAAGIPLARYDALEPQARAILARKVAMSGSQLLRKDFSLSVVLGTVSLTTPLTASEPMLLEFLRFARITSSGVTQPWQFLPDYAQLSLERPTFGMIHFCLVGTDLKATDTSGALDTLTTTATVNSSYVPLASSLSGNADLEELAISQLAELAAGGGNAQAAQV